VWSINVLLNDLAKKKTKFIVVSNHKYTTPKVIMQGKLIAVAGSLWAEFVNKNRYISVRFISEEVKSIEF